MDDPVNLFEPERDSISVSQAITYLRCPQQHYYRYVRGLVMPPDGRTARGQAIHVGQAWAYNQLLRSGVRPKVSDVVDVAVTELKAQLEHAVLRKDEKKSVLKDSTAKATQVYQQNVGQRIDPVAVERRIEAEPGGIKVVGVLDVMERRGNRFGIRDTKTVSRKMDLRSEPAGILQAPVYVVLAQADGYRRLDSEVVLDQIIIRSKDVEYERVPVRIGKTAIARAMNLLARVSQLIRARIYYRNPTGWWCDPQYCGYYRLCWKEWKEGAS